MTTSLISYDEFMNLLRTENTYFFNSYEQAAIRSELKNGEVEFYIKFKDQNEFKAKKGNEVVANAWREHRLITKQDYNNF